MNKKILLIGGGGHCKSVLDSLLELNSYSEIGIIDKEENLGKTVMGIPIIGTDVALSFLLSEGYQHAFVTIGSIGNPAIRINLYNVLQELGYEIPFIIDTSAVVSKYAKISQGVFIGKHSIVNAGAQIHCGAIINTGAIIEHDSHIHAFAHIAPGAVLGGEVVVGENTHIGLNATLKQQVHVGSNTIIGMGSVVTNDIEKSTIAYGNPCKVVRKRCVYL